MVEYATATGGEQMHKVIELASARGVADAAVRTEETALLLQVREHADREAFTRLFARFAPRLKYYLRGLGCDHATGEGIVQDVMIAVWTKAALFDPAKASARTWIYTLVRNRMIDLHRVQAREQTAFERYGHDLVDEVDDGREFSRAAGEQIAGLLEELPPEQTRILLLAYVEGKSHREIARELGIPTGTVKSRARLAFQRLRKRLEAGT